jgi:hypothetical protein
VIIAGVVGVDAVEPVAVKVASWPATVGSGETPPAVVVSAFATLT